MHQVVDLTNPRVFIDDDDPAIVYEGPWATSSTSTDVGSINTPLYGTLHTAVAMNSFPPTKFTFRYTFNGTGYDALFFSSQQAIHDFQTSSNDLGASPLKLDNFPQSHFIFDPSGGILLSSENAILSDIEHNLNFGINGTADGISLDGFFITPRELPTEGVDISYDMNASLANSGDSWEVHFNGLSASIYASVMFNTTRDAAAFSLSYNIDQGSHVNFTLPDTTHTAGLPSQQLLIQTPPLSPGTHMLTLTLVKPPPGGSNFNMIRGINLMVQNRTRSRILQTVPPIPSSITTSSSEISPSISSDTHSSPLTTSKGINDNNLRPAVIAGITVGLVVTLLVGLWLWRRIVRKRQTHNEDHTSVAKPFSGPELQQVRRFRLAQYTTREKTNKYREALGVLAPGLPRSTEMDEAEDQPRRIRYRLHEDGGEVTDLEHGNVNDDDDVISLPPIYATLRRSLSELHTSHSTPADAQPL